MTIKRISIVGQKFRGLDTYLTGFAAGSLAYLVRERDNRYDANAVQVWVDGKHVGYLPKANNAALATYLDRLPARESSPLANDERLDEKDRGRIAGLPTLVVKFSRSANQAYPQIEYDDEALNG